MPAERRGWTGYAFGPPALVRLVVRVDGATEAAAKAAASKLYRERHGRPPFSVHAVAWKRGPDVLRRRR